ncbi:TetR/AcrR family transcriptional regulator [Aciduricibacillus chroicocephali]|uniref:TetR/AcrR family transcriptional regulator n=1 Tax=Aciduricibacillus chroicocephali TaxID=3054939 RepID=A0ABY9KYM0_9BACI|nr:TetR/AcrR family transcriptional regulator [Bacillaceae bacterium 44XB]
MGQDYQHLENSHEKILRVARDLFMKLGYKAVSTRQIAEICGITQPTLYHHFKNKQQLYVEVLKSELAVAKSDFKSIISAHCHSFEECIYELSAYMLINKPTSLGQMFHDIAHHLSDEQQNEMREKWLDAYLQPIVSVFEKGIEQGAFRNPADFGSFAEPSAYMLMNLIASHQSREPLKEEDARKQAKFYTNVMMYGLSSRSD